MKPMVIREYLLWELNLKIYFCHRFTITFVLLWGLVFFNFVSWNSLFSCRFKEPLLSCCNKEKFSKSTLFCYIQNFTIVEHVEISEIGDIFSTNCLLERIEEGGWEEYAPSPLDLLESISNELFSELFP